MIPNENGVNHTAHWPHIPRDSESAALSGFFPNEKARLSFREEIQCYPIYELHKTSISITVYSAAPQYIYLFPPKDILFREKHVREIRPEVFVKRKKYIYVTGR